jgi:hypothetical protein
MKRRQRSHQKKAHPAAVQTTHSFLQARPFETNEAANESATAKAGQLTEATRQTGFNFASLPIQAKLTIGKPGDQYEQEADRVAHQVVNQINSPSVQQQQNSEEEELQAKPLGIQPLTGQRRGALAEGTASSELEGEIQRARGSGQALDASIRQPMEQTMGADFSRVKIHADANADQLSQSIQAKAFTTGNDIFFKQGEYNPSSRGGQELLAHELTHVVQQGGGGSAINRSMIQANRARSNATTEAPDLNNILKVATLHMHVDLDAPGMALLKQLQEGEVGHAWVALEWNDPNNIPDDLPEAHKKQIRSGADPFGFWPKKFDWHDYTGLTEGEVWNQLLQDNQDEYNEYWAMLTSSDFKQRYEEHYGNEPTDPELQDLLREKIQEDCDLAQLWGGIHTRAADSVGYSSNPFDSYVPGQVLHPDYMHDAKATQSYELTRTEVDNVLQYAEAKQNADYSVFFYNCTTFAKEAVQAAGKTPPSSGIGKVCYPDKLYKSIKSNFEKGKGTTALEVNDQMVRRVGADLEPKRKKKK